MGNSRIQNNGFSYQTQFGTSFDAKKSTAKTFNHTYTSLTVNGLTATVSDKDVMKVVDKTLAVLEQANINYNEKNKAKEAAFTASLAMFSDAEATFEEPVVKTSYSIFSAFRNAIPSFKTIFG